MRKIDDNIRCPNDDPKMVREWLPEDAANWGIICEMMTTSYEKKFVLDANFKSNETKALPKRPEPALIRDRIDVSLIQADESEDVWRTRTV